VRSRIARFVHEAWRCSLLIWKQLTGAMLRVSLPMLDLVLARFSARLAKRPKRRRSGHERFLRLIGFDAG
jgi:hypothetical protein